MRVDVLTEIMIRARRRLAPLSLFSVLGATLCTCGSDGPRPPLPPTAADDIAAVRAACAADRSHPPGLLEPWPANGPGTVEPVPIVHPRTPEIVYVLSGPAPSPLFASVDGAKSFCPLTAPALDWVVISPSNPRILFGGSGDQLFTTTDAGRAWQSAGIVGGVPANGNAGRVTVHPSRSDVLFTSPRGGYVADAEVAFDRSNDGGRSWSTVQLPGQTLVIDGALLAVGPGGPGAYYVTVRANFTGDGVTSHLHVSRDAGLTWTARALPTNQSVGLLATNDGRLVLTAEGVWTSIDDGATWHRAAPLPLELVEPHGFAPAGAPPGMFFAIGRYVASATAGITVFKTTTGGAAWIEVRLPANTDQHDIVPGASGRMLYWPSHVGLFRTEDDGASWDLRWMDVHGTIAASADGRSLLATFSNALFFSINGGETWLPRPTPLNAVLGAVSPNDPATFYLTEQVATENRLRKSSDGGVTWAAILDFWGVSSIVVAADGTLFVADSVSGSAYNGVYRSYDGGGTFKRVLNENIAKLEVAAGGSRLYASWSANGCHDIGQPSHCIMDLLFVSDDQGTSWRPTEVSGRFGRGETPADGNAIAALVAHPTDPTIVAVVVAGLGLFVSHDAGATFHPLATPMRDQHQVAAGLLATSGDTLFITSAQGRSPSIAAIFGHSLVGPGDWTEIAPATLPEVRSMARGPAGGLVVSTEGGLFRTRP